MVNDSKGSSKKMRVVDRRRFTEDGIPRQDDSAAQATPQQQEETAETPQPPPTERPVEPASTSEDFLELVAMLAQQAEIMMVGAEDLPAQPLQAKRLIDYLGAVETKTQGNLSTQEAQLLSNLVFQLRTMYVQASR